MSHAHNYVITSQTGDGMTEVCTECKKRLKTRYNASQRYDNRQYLVEHVRDTAQPRGRTAKVFNKYYKNNK